MGGENVCFVLQLIENFISAAVERKLIIHILLPVLDGASKNKNL